MRWASNGTFTSGRTAAITSGPKVRLGTKRPSITSHWIQSTPAFSRAATSSPRRAKSAGRTDGTMRMGAVFMALVPPCRDRGSDTTDRAWQRRSPGRGWAQGMPSSPRRGRRRQGRRDDAVATLLDVTPTEETGATKAGAEAKTPMRVVLIDDHQIVLDGLTAMLRPHRDKVDVVGRARDAEEAVATVRRLEPDLCLLDIRLKATSGLDLCVDLRRRVPACKVVFLTVYDDEQYLFQALQAGRQAFC